MHLRIIFCTLFVVFLFKGLPGLPGEPGDQGGKGEEVNSTQFNINIFLLNQVVLLK